MVGETLEYLETWGDDDDNNREDTEWVQGASTYDEIVSLISLDHARESYAELKCLWDEFANWKREHGYIF